MAFSIHPRGRAGTEAVPRADAGAADRGVAGGPAVLYLLLSIILLPPSEHLRALGSGIAVFGVVGAIGSLRGPGRLSGFSVMAAAFAAFAVLVTPTLPAMGGTAPAAVPIGFLGVHAAALVWAALRWVPRSPARAVPLRTALRFGLISAAGLLLITTVPIAIGMVTDPKATVPLLWIYPVYLAGFLAAATVYWLLQRIIHLAAGRYLVGVLAGTFVYAAGGVVLAVLKNEPIDLARIALIGVIAGSIVGPAVAFHRARNT